VKTVLISILTVLVSASLAAQDDLLKKRRAKKLQSAFLDKNSWFTDYEKARAEAKKTRRGIFAYFTRSYAP
jgi:hypothetical protein